MKLWALLIVAFLLMVAGEQGTQSECYDVNGLSSRCEPRSQSFSFGLIPEVNSTCGSPPTEFCSRQYNIFLGTVTSTCSDVCDASSSVNSHPPLSMTDFLLNAESWWQSENSLDTQDIVVIDLALQTLVQVEVIRFSFVSFMPKSFYILKSDDFGQTYSPYHYFAVSCIDTFGVEPDQMLDLANETTVLCQSIDLPPLPGAKSFFPRLGRPSTNDSIPGYSSMLFDFLAATNIRVVLAEHFPLSDLAVDDFGYYYAISDLNVVGSCQCNGHASNCLKTPISLEYECDCQHNTAGLFCERCADMYQDRPWQRANGNGEIECQICNCNGHSSECVFDPDVYRISGDTSGGVCIGCQDNTAGRQCEQCASFFYRIPGLNISSAIGCQACNCNLAGVLDDGQCATTQSVDVGQCFCKSRVVGLTCEQCTTGFFNLTAENPDGCQDCNCNSVGALSNNCDPISGLCECKQNVVGYNCDQCLPNFYQPNPTSGEGCLACNCNPGGSISSQCDRLTGQCVCRRGIQGRTCSEIIDGYFYPSVDYLRLEAEDVTTNQIIPLTGENEQFTGTGYAKVTSASDQLNLGYLTAPASGLYAAFIRYNLEGVTVWESISLSIIASTNIVDDPFSCGQNLNEITGNSSVVFSSLMMGSGVTTSARVCLREGQSYNFMLNNFLSGNFNISSQLEIDSLFLVLTNAPKVSVFDDSQLSSEYMECINTYSRVTPQSLVTVSCASTIFTVSAAIYNGTLECGCDETGSERGTTCEAFGGQCICLPGVRGRLCDMCIPSYYNLTSNGCSRCDCNVDGSVDSYCDTTTGLCDCRDKIVERDCSSCSNGFRNLGGLDCFSCNCSAIGSVNSICDDTTGVCECKPGVTGLACDRCADYHYNFQQSGCRSCDCNAVGSIGATCDLTTGHCSCVTNVIGRNCSSCRPGTFNLQGENPDGCQSCFCSGLTSECSSASGFVQSSVVSIFDSTRTYPLDGWLINPNDTNKVTQEDDGLLVLNNFEGSISAPSKFLGNKLSSYSQYLQVNITSAQLNMFVDPISPYNVVLASKSIQLVANLSEINDGVFLVQFHETAGWINSNSSTPPSELDLQLVLSSLTSLSLSVNFNTDVFLSRISLETAVRISDPDTQVSWVEECECPLGYSGLSCEDCARGYTRTSQNTCELCECNGFSADCHPESGVCINCTEATEGSACGVCQQGYFGDPLSNISCKPCPCPLIQLDGQFSDDCVLSNGEAVCINCAGGHTGQNCESCRSGYFGDPTGGLVGQPTMCSDCSCNGNINRNDPLACNATTGICIRCLGNTVGDQCEQCSEGFYGDAIMAKNCTACSCDNRGSASGVCNRRDGQCSCLNNVIGRSCDRCTPSYFGLGEPSGCVSCGCDPIGSVTSQCDDSGQCTCLSGITGRNCDQCLQGYFNFSMDGCQECSCSPNNSQSSVCQANGVCICLPGSTGSGCRECVRNYFQTSEGCTACPSCYQEIENEAEVTEGQYATAQDRLLILRDMLIESGIGPFDPRLVNKQQMVGNINAIINAFSIRESSLTARYNNLLTIIMNVIQSQSTAIQISLEALKSSSTTVLVLGSTSRELVDRIKDEFFTVNSFIYIIRNDLLPSIQLSSDRIQASVNGSMNVSQILTQTIQSVSGQFFEIQTDLVQIAALLSSAQRDLINISQLLSNTSEILNRLYQVRDAAVVDGNRITAMVNDLSFNLQLLKNLISQLQSLPNCVEKELLRYLISVSQATENDVNIDILSEMSSQREQLRSLNQTLTQEISTLNVLQGQLAEENNSSVYQDARAKYLQNEWFKLEDSVSQQINIAKAILQNLQNFSDNSLQIAIQADMALQHVTIINESAAYAWNEAQLLQQRISQSRNQVDTKRSITYQTSDLISSAQQDIMSLNTSSLLEVQALSTEQANLEVDAMREISSEIQNIHPAIDNELNNTRAIAESVADIRGKHNMTLSTASTAQSAVNKLLEAFEQLEISDPNAITRVEALLDDVSSELTLANIEYVVSFLRMQVETQIEQKNYLEATVSNLQEQVDYLDKVHLNLPSDCNN